MNTHTPTGRALLPRLVRASAAALALCLGLVASAAAQNDYVVDNADASVQARGNWTRTTTTPGFFGDDYQFRVPGNGSSTVRWPFPENAPAGVYELFAHWSSGPNRATNATYQVDHAGGRVTVGVNQQVEGGAWRSLGRFEFAPSKGHGVNVHDRADGVVVADAVRWLPTSGAPQAMQAIVPTPAPTGGTSSSPLTAAPTPTINVAVPISPSTPGAATAPRAPTPRPNDPRYFEQTRYRIGEDAFWDFFQKRGGVRTFGYPVSNTFELSGLKVQIFQRLVMQLQPDGGVQTMNVLDEGIMPYTRMNGSTFPAPDSEVMRRAPDPVGPDYHAKVLEFVQEMAPNEFDGHKVNFGRTFLSTVRSEDAFPGGVPEELEGLLPYFNLEIWGLPISRPMYEPTNRNFIYQRFQRGVMHYDKGCDCTQGLLLADYFKAIMVNRNLPPDLSEQARGSRFFAQWSSLAPLGLQRPQDLPGSNFAGAFFRDPVVTIDPGHGANEIGSAASYPDGTIVREKDLNLRVALRVRELLEKEAGYQVVMTRTTDVSVNGDGRDLTGDGRVNVSDDLQARVDVANRSGSDLLVSIHFNGSSNREMGGTFMFWAPERPFSDRNRALAESVQAAMVKSLRDAGYNTADRGARTDQSVLGGSHYYLLSPKTDIVARPSEMPALIGEPLFLTNEADARALRDDRIVEAVAHGYAEGIRAYFQRFPPD